MFHYDFIVSTFKSSTTTAQIVKNVEEYKNICHMNGSNKLSKLGCDRKMENGESA